MESYYKNRLLSIAHSQFDRFIAKRYKVLESGTVDLNSITQLDKEKQLYLVKSSSREKLHYKVDLSLGICECQVDCTGQPRKHQAAVVLHFKVPCISFILSLNASGRQQYAMIALEKEVQKTEFYASLYQKENDGKYEKSLAETVASTKVNNIGLICNSTEDVFL